MNESRTRQHETDRGRRVERRLAGETFFRLFRRLGWPVDWDCEVYLEQHFDGIRPGTVPAAVPFAPLQHPHDRMDPTVRVVAVRLPGGRFQRRRRDRERTTTVGTRKSLRVPGENRTLRRTTNYFCCDGDGGTLSDRPEDV